MTAEIKPQQKNQKIKLRKISQKTEEKGKEMENRGKQKKIRETKTVDPLPK